MKKTLRTVFTAMLALQLALCLFCVSAFAEKETARPEESQTETAASSAGEDGTPTEEIDIQDEEVPVAAVPANKNADAARQVTGENGSDTLNMAGAILAIAALAYVVIVGKKRGKN